MKTTEMLQHRRFMSESHELRLCATVSNVPMWLVTFRVNDLRVLVVEDHDAAAVEADLQLRYWAVEEAERAAAVRNQPMLLHHVPGTSAPHSLFSLLLSFLSLSFPTVKPPPQSSLRTESGLNFIPVTLVLNSATDIKLYSFAWCRCRD